MFGLIEGWLSNSLGINCNLNNLEENNIFQDGCVLARILQKYSVINEDFNRCIHTATTKAECVKNLKLLKPVFGMLKIKYNDTIINEIVENQVGKIINLLYEIFICLENKQHLYFMTNQTFEKVCQDTTRSLNSFILNESVPVKSSLSEKMCFEKPIINNADIIKWYKDKYEKVKNTLEAKVEHLKNPVSNKVVIKIKPTCKSCLTINRQTANSGSVEALPELDSFLKENSDRKLLDYETFVASYKSKQSSKAAKNSLENSIQHDLLQSTWRKIEERKSKIHSLVFSDLLLKQSHYEKQLLYKLIETQNVTHIQNQNNIFGKNSFTGDHEDTLVNDIELKEKFKTMEQIYKNDRNRVLVLHKKLYKEKKEMIKNNIYNICMDVVNDLLELVFSAIEYKNNRVDVFEDVWHNSMQRFVKSQPICVYSSIGDIEYDEAISFQKEQDETLNESDVEEYLLTQGKWFFSNIFLDHETGLNEEHLAFIVYRLLTLKYPLPPSPSAAHLPPFRITGVLLNFHNTDAIEKLKILLSKPQVHVFDIDMVVKFCTKQFEIETAPPPEEKTKGKSRDVKAIKQNVGKIKKESKKKSSKLSPKSLPVLNSTTDKLPTAIDKETQTVSENEDEKKTERTSLGLLGEEVSNAIKEGRNINDSLLSTVIIEYLKSLKDYNGWLLLNYPATIEQAFHLELALTGKKIPMENFDSAEENSSLHVEELDEWSDKRKSKLLNYPLSETDTQSFQSFFTIVLKVEEEGHEVQKVDNNLTDNDQESLTSDEVKENKVLDLLKKFYSKLAIYREFYSSSFNVDTLKLLARVILNVENIEAKRSVDLFGEEILNKLTKGKKPDKKGKSSLTSKKHKSSKDRKSKDKNNNSLKKHSDSNKGNGVLNIVNHETDLYIIQNIEDVDDLHTSDQDKQSRNFVCLPLNHEFGVLLATTWENIESCYLSNLKDILFENRFINLRLQPYRIYIQEEIKKIVSKQDLKQNLVNIFQEYYNNISNELRTLPDIKNQLHCRVMEMQQSLWDIADERKNELEGKRRAIIYENWLFPEICMLMNNYLSLVQTEFERSVETLKLVNDYHMDMLERIPSTLAIPKEKRHVDRIHVEEFHNNSQKLSDIEQQAEKINKKINGINLMINNLIHCNGCKTPIDIFYSLFEEIISDAKFNFNSILQMYLDQNKSEANNVANFTKAEIKVKIAKKKNSIQQKEDYKSSKISNRSFKEMENQMSEKQLLLIEEWEEEIKLESERLYYRMDLICQRAKENILEYYCSFDSLFCNFHRSILSKYNSEISDINVTCGYLKTAIEKELVLNDPVILGQERFFVNVEDDENKCEEHSLSELTEDYHDCIFTIKQLKYLVDIFRTSSPTGVIRKQPLCYILQDLMYCETRENQPYLPKMWCFLNEVQLRNVIDSMFGLEFGVDWRDFIIYNLDIPYPDIKEILHLRNQFLSFDSEETELISVADYESITLWFEKDLPINPKQGLRFALVKKLLSELFKVDSQHINYTALLLYFCKDVNSEYGFKKALSLSLGKNVVISKSELDMIIENEVEIKQIVCSVLEDVINGIVVNRETAQVYELPESYFQLSHLSNESSEDSLRSSMFASFKSESLKSLGHDLKDISSHSTTIGKERTSQRKFLKTPIVEKQWVTKIPVSSVLNVLNACFFNLSREITKHQYLTGIDEAADSDDMIEAYDLINLVCIRNIFMLSNKFKILIPCDILTDCLKDDTKVKMLS